MLGGRQVVDDDGRCVVVAFRDGHVVDWGAGAFDDLLDDLEAAEHKSVEKP